MSDIFVKSTTGSGGWKKITNLFVKSTTGSGGWAAAAGVWIRNTTQWLKVWPLSGIFATRVPYIADFSSDTYANRLTSASKLRIGTSYFGDNAQWDLNGWSASSYTYRWKLYDQFGQDLQIELASGAGSGWTSTAGENQLLTSVWTSTNSTNADTQFLAFEVTANNSSNSQYDGVSVSTKIQVIREQPSYTGSPQLSTNSPAVGTAITYTSPTWNTTQARKADPNRIYIQWYTNSTSTTTGGTYVGSGSSYTPVAADNGKYIYVIETRQNSGTDYDLGIATGVVASVVTTSAVSSAPSAFTYSLTNASSVTTPSAPTQTRVSTTSNTVLVEMAASFPSDTESYELLSYGDGSNAGGTISSPAIQTITTLNQYNSSGNFVATGGTYDTVLSISSSASNSSISTYAKAYGKTRSINVNASTTSGAQSWAVSWNLSGASGGNGTYISNTDSLPLTITVGGASNPTISINSVTAYSGLGQTGATRAGTAGSPTSLSSIAKPTSQSSTSSLSYTYYANNQLAESKRRVTLPVNFANNTNVYVSTNGFIGIGTDPSTTWQLPLPTTGLFLTPLFKDSSQTYLYYYSDSTNFFVRWKGFQLGSTDKISEYQAKFYYDSNVVDVYFITNLLDAYDTNAVYNNSNSSTVTQTWAQSTLQASTLLAVAGMTRNTSRDGTDDGNTLIAATKPLVAPTILTLPVITPTTGTQGATTYTTTNGTWTNSPTSYSYQWRYFDQGSVYPAAPASIISPNTSTGQTYRPPSNFVSLYGTALYCDVVANNGLPSGAARSAGVAVSAGGGSTPPFFPPHFPPFFPPFFPPHFPPFFPPFFPPHFPPFFPPHFPEIGGPTISNLSVSGTGRLSRVLSWTSTGQGSYSIATSPTTALNGATGSQLVSRTFTGLTAATTYNVTVTIYSGSLQTGTTVSASTSFTT